MPHVPAEADGDARVDRVILEYLEAVDAGGEPDRAALLAAHPDLADDLRAFFADQDHVARATCAARGPTDETPRGRPTTADDLLPESIGGYRLLRLLGEGGMGRVYEAEDSCGDRVALKLLAPSVADSLTALERFRQEGRLASRITHPRCVFVRTADEEAGRPYIVMELMSGVTLKDLVTAAGPLEPADAVQKILDVIEGLEEAHRAGVLHRDVKPANCYVDAVGRVKVGDFGLSRSLATAVHLTGPGGFVGTPLFASPEQLKGEPLDPRTDVYSVTATLYYLLTGQAPFQHHDGARVIARVVSEPAPPPRHLRPDLSPALEAVVLRGLERQRERRFATLGDLREALRPFLPGQMTIAGLGLRAGAYLLDALPFSVASEVSALLLISKSQFLTLPVYLAMVTPLVLYFLLLEGFWDRTPGKWLLGLRVTTATGWERPTWRQILIRTALFFATGGVVTNLLLFVFGDSEDMFHWSLLSLVGLLLSLTARLGTMRARNGYRCLHDLLSETRVVQLPLASPRGSCGQVALTESHRPEDVRTVRLPADEVLPRRLGPFRIHGALRWDSAERILLADDPSLDRRVWVCLRPGEAKGDSPARRAVGRPTRLRWLNGGQEAGWSWDAYVAPAGAPLADWVATHGPLDWSATRLLLEQLVEELKAAAEDGTCPTVLTRNQVWLRPGGRVELLDSPVEFSPESLDGDKSALALVREAAALALEGRCHETGWESQSIRAIVPLHARRLLDRLTDPRRADEGVRQLAEDLSGLRGRPTEVTAALRAFHLALTLCFVSIGLLVMLCWSRNGALSHLLRLDREMTHLQVLREVLDDPEAGPALLASLPEGDPLRADPQRHRLFLDDRQTLDWQEFEVRLASLGWQESLAHVTPHLAHRARLGGPVERLRLDRLSEDGFRLRPYRLDLAEEQRETLSAAQLGSVAARARGDLETPWNKQFRSMVLMFLVTLTVIPVLLVLSACAWRGGLALRLVGLALARADGQEAGRLQAAWRAVLIWMPIALALGPIPWIDVERLDLLWLCPVFQGCALFLCAGHAVLALRSPRRSVVDWLAGTYVVPR